MQDSFEQNIKTKKYTLIVDKKDTVRTTVTASNYVNIQSTLGDVTLRAVDVKAGGKVELAALNGDVNLSANKDVDFRHEVINKNNGIWFEYSDQGHINEKVQHTTIDAGDGLTITVGTNGSVNVDYKDFGNLDKSIERLSQEPGLEWMAQVKAGTTPAQWNAIKEAHKSWDFRAQDLTPEAAMIIALAAAAVTAGSGATAAVSAAFGDGALGAAMAAGYTAFISAEWTAIIGNKGNIGKALRQLGSSETVRSIAMAMASAGLMQGLPSNILPKGSFLELNPTQALQKFTVQTVVKTAISTGIGGQEVNEAFKNSVTSTATDMLSAYTFNAIGDLGAMNSDIMGDGSVLKAMAHGVAGGFIAELTGKEFSAGAIGAAATELMSGALAEVDPELRVQMAGIIGATAVMLTGGSAEDMQMAQQIGQSVALNNHMMHPDFKDRMDKKLEEEKDKYPELTQEKLSKLQEACGKSHCFNTWLERWFGNGDISETDLKSYANENGFGEFTSEEIKEFAELHETVRHQNIRDQQV